MARSEWRGGGSRRSSSVRSVSAHSVEWNLLAQGMVAVTSGGQLQTASHDEIISGSMRRSNWVVGEGEYIE